MDIVEKITILSAAAKYDASCASSGSIRQSSGKGIGNGAVSGICHSWSSDGRCVSLLKILMTNICIYDCKYCVNRKSNDIKRAYLSPLEIATLTVDFYKRNYIEGLFLSSGVIKSPDYTMELFVRTAELLRKKFCFNGYIHMKIIPGSDRKLIEKITALADRVSANLELPTEEGLKEFAPDKSRKDIVSSLGTVKNYMEESRIRASTTTQLIIGATADSDKTIITQSERFLQKRSA